MSDDVTITFDLDNLPKGWSVMLAKATAGDPAPLMQLALDRTHIDGVPYIESDISSDIEIGLLQDFMSALKERKANPGN